MRSRQRMGVLKGGRRPWVQVASIGDGPAVLIVAAAQGHWRWLAPTFEPMGSRYRVLLGSLRGERGDGAPLDFALHDLVEDLEEALDVAGEERASLVGSSFGGAVALAFALERPARVQALVLNVTTARLRDHERPVQLLRRSFVLSPSLAGWLVHAYAAWRSLPEYLVLSPAAAWATLRRALPVALRHGTPEAVLARRLLVLADVDLEARLPDLRCPALVLTGEDTLDGLVGPRSRRALLERIPHVEHRVVPRTGHFGAFTAPDATLAAVCDFLDRVVR